MTLAQLQEQLTGLEGHQRKTDEQLRQQAEGRYKNQYDSNLRMLQNSINENVAQQNRNALSTGMQRSSYNQAAQASIRNQGLESQKQLASEYEANVANALYQLMAKEDEREDAANAQKNQLLMALYEYGRAEEASKRRSGGGGGVKKDPNDINGDGVVNALDTLLKTMNTVAETGGGAKASTVLPKARIGFEIFKNLIFTNTYNSK